MKELYKRFESTVDLSGQGFKDYMTSLLEITSTRDLVKGDARFEWVRSKAHRVAFQANDCFATGKFFADYKTLVYTFCFRNGIQVPRDWKGNY